MPGKSDSFHFISTRVETRYRAAVHFVANGKPFPMPSSGPIPRARAGRGLILAVATLTASAGAILVAPAAHASQSYDVTIETPAQSPLVGEPFVIRGAVSPAAVGQRVRLQRFWGGRFHTVANDRLDGTSSYSFAQVFDTAGGRTFRVAKKARGSIGAGVSSMRRVWVTGNTLNSAMVIKSGNSLLSENGSFTLRLLPSGDLVITLTSDGRLLWSFGTGGNPHDTAVLQRDGNLVVHDAHGAVIKTSGSGGHRSGAYTMTMREDSNLEIDSPSGAAVWSSNTTNHLLKPKEILRPGQYLRSDDRAYQVVMQHNGNLVIYDRHHTAVWESATSAPGSHLVMGPGGSLTIYGPLGKELWSTNTPGHPGAYASLETDGNLVVYRKGKAIWSSGGIGGVIGDDYPPRLRDAAKDSLIDPWRFYNRECTSFVAWRMNSANGVDFSNFMDGGRFGSAYNWDDNARALGFKVDNVPARGAIAESDAYGHVAWVAAVGDGTVTIEDYNWKPGAYDVRTVPTSTYVYIHIKDL
jgi:surface antigen